MAKASFLDFTAYVDERSRDFTGRRGLIDALNAWIADSNGSVIFLILGEPSGGKTALAAQFVQFARGTVAAPPGCTALGPGFLHSFHFCRVQDPLTLDSTIFAQSLALQLKARLPKFYEIVLANSTSPVVTISYEQTGYLEPGASVTGMQVNHLHVGNVEARVVFNRLVEIPLRILLREARESPIVVLVDGLDEALPYERGGGIAQLLASMGGASRRGPGHCHVSSDADGNEYRQRVRGDHLHLFSGVIHDPSR